MSQYEIKITKLKDNTVAKCETGNLSYSEGKEFLEAIKFVIITMFNNLNKNIDKKPQ